MPYDFHSSALRPTVDRSLINGWVWGGVVAVSLLSLLPAQAQVIPDATLGAGNNSVTSTTGNRTDILGGLRRNSSLFHSFDRFDILTNQQVYFANPADIRNIFSRVTGGTISNIDGLLGVSGSANLFLMNPNGIIFGPNARLDVAGSFLATTANALEFADNQRFAATGDRAVPLVEVNIPIGVQFGANPPAMLTNRGNLATGQNLTLAAGNLDLQGQVRSGGDLTLNATDTVRIRDMVTEPFLARSGGNLTIQGNQGIDILALNHLSQTPFVSGGNLSLIGDGVISTDAHFTAGGDFTIRTLAGNLGSFVSLYDPIITVGGNYAVGDYAGASLRVDAGGDITYGTVVIAAVDPAVHPTNAAFFLNAGGSITGTGTVSSPFSGFNISDRLLVDFQSRGAIDIRGMVTQGGSINLNSSEGSINTNGETLNTTWSSFGGIGGSFFGNSGNVTLTANQNILLGDVSTFASGARQSGSNLPSGGTIFATTANGNISAGNLNTIASQGNGGAINLSANNGNISISNLDTRSLGIGFTIVNGFPTVLSGVGGEISLTATNGTIDTGNLNTSASGSTNSGFFIPAVVRAGAINLTTVNGDISATNFNVDANAPSNAGSAGTINLSATNGSIDVGNLSAVANALTGRSGDGGAISLSTLYTGAITPTATGDIHTGDVSSYSSSPAPFVLSLNSSLFTGNGGAISFSTNTGNVSTGNLQSYSGHLVAPYYNRATSGNGGAIQISTNRGNISTSGVNTLSYAAANPGIAGNGGAVRFTANDGNINTGGISTESIALGTTGNGGDVYLVTQQGDVTLGTLYATSTTADGGMVNIGTYNGNVNATGSISSYSGDSSSQTTGTAGAITVSAVGGGLTLQDLFALSYNGRGADIQLNSDGDILTGSLITTGKLGSGNIQVATDGAFSVRSGSSANGSSTSSLSILSSDTFGSGRSGDIQVTAQSIALVQGSQISASTHSNGDGGNITIMAPARVQISGVSTGGILLRIPTGSGAGVTGGASDPVYLGGYLPTGDASQAANPNSIFPSGVFSQATINSTGNAGNITIATGQLLVQDSAAIGVTTFGQGNAGSVNILAQDIGLDNGSIFSGVAPGSVSTSGTIALQGLHTLQATNSRISVSTDSGVAGNVTITADQGNAPSIFLNNSTIEAAARQAAGQAGGVAITTPTLTLIDSTIVTSNLNATSGGSVTFTNLDSLTALNSLISASTESGVGGNVAMTGGNLQLDNSAIAATTASGSAGNLSISASGNVSLNNNSRLTVAATAGGTAGNLTVQAGRIRINQSEITVSSPTGPSGNLTLSTPDLRLDLGTLSAETGGSGSGANITLEGLRAPLLLRHGSLISASAGARANGGNITILSPSFVIGPMLEDNDIIANAIAGNGGKITITTNTIFGLEFRSSRTPRSDITASSETGASGTVALNTLNLDPSKGLVQLPTIPVDRANQLTQGCATGGDAKNNDSSFGLAGRGGVPASPTAPFAAAITTHDWVSLDSSQALGGVTFSNGITLDIMAQSDRSPVTCVDAWKLQQRSRLSPSPLSPAQHEVFKTQQRAQQMLLEHPRFRRVPPLGALLVRVEHWL